MSLSLGQILSGAGRVGVGMRKEEEAQRTAQENQLKIEEQNRLNQMRKDMEGYKRPEVPLITVPTPQNLRVREIPLTKSPEAAQAAPMAAAPTAEQQQLERIKMGNILPPGSQMPVPPPTAAQQAEMARYAQMKQNLPSNVVGGAVVSGLNAARNFIAPQLAPTGTLPDRVKAKPGTTIPAKTYSGELVENGITATLGDSYLLPTNPGNILPKGELMPTAQQQTAQQQTAQNINPFAAAQRKVESGNNATAVSPKGATGIMQVMPDTAMDPGFGVPNIFDFAAGMGYTVKGRTAKEAKALLNNPEIGGAFGDMYMNAMIQNYGGNTTYALAAYNMGPKATDKWIAAGADINKLPKETRDYIPRVEAAFGKQTQPSVIKDVPITADGTIVKTADAKPPTIAQQKKVTDFYLSNPNAVSGDMQRALRQRDQLVQLAGMYQRAGIGDKFVELSTKITELDEGMYYLQGMDGLQQLSYFNNPLKLNAVVSHFAGGPIEFVPRTDGLYDMMSGQNMIREGITVADVGVIARSAFDKGFVQQTTAMNAKVEEKRLESMIKREEDVSKIMAETIKDSIIKNIEGGYNLRQEVLKTPDYEAKPYGDQQHIIITPRVGRPYLLNIEGVTQEVDGIKVKDYTASSILGLPTR